MSVHASSDVWRHSRQNGTRLLLLLAIADMANDDNQAYPGVKTLAARVRCSERQVRVMLGDLEKAGELRIAHRKTDGCDVNMSNLYTVLVTKEWAEKQPPREKRKARNPDGINRKSNDMLLSIAGGGSAMDSMTGMHSIASDPSVDPSFLEPKDSAPQSAALTLLEISEQINPSITIDLIPEPIVMKKSATSNGEGTAPLIPNCAQPLSPAPVAPADENAPERAASPVIDIRAIAPLANATGLTTREFAATTTPILSAPDAPIAKPKRGRKAKPATPEEQAGGEAERADFEDAKLAVCYAWQKNPLKDPRGWVWVTMMANFLVGRVGKKQQGSQWDTLKLDDTPLTAAQICGFRQWWHDPERLAGMEAPPLPTVLETLQRRVQEYVADRRIGRFAEQGAAKLAEVRAEYERATSGASAVERQSVVPDEHDMIDQDRLAQLQAMIARSAALHGRREAA